MFSVQIYSDGSLRESGIGGWAAVLLVNGTYARTLSGWERNENSDSEAIELIAVYKALTHVSETHQEGTNVVVHTDCSSIVKAMTGRIDEWQVSGWKTVYNARLWRAAE